MPSKYRYKNTVVQYPTGRVYTRDIMRDGKIAHKKGSPIIMFLAYGSGSSKDKIMPKPKIVSYDQAKDLVDNKGYDRKKEKKKMKEYTVKGEYLGIVDGRRAYNKIVGETDIFKEAVHKMTKPTPAVIPSTQVRYLAKAQGFSPMEANQIIRDMDKLGLLELHHEDFKLRRKAEKQAEKEEAEREAMAAKKKKVVVTAASLLKKKPAPKKKKVVEDDDEEEVPPPPLSKKKKAEKEAKAAKKAAKKKAVEDDEEEVPPPPPSKKQLAAKKAEKEAKAAKKKTVVVTPTLVSKVQSTKATAYVVTSSGKKKKPKIAEL